MLIAAIVVAVQAAGASGARTAPQHITTSLAATGEITRLGLSRIAIPGLRCAVPAKLAMSAGRFVIGDPVKISCLNGSLRSVKYSPELATAQSTATGGGNAPTTTPTSRPEAASTLRLRPGSPTASARSSSAAGRRARPSARPGPISDLSDSSLTVADLTCSFNFSALILQVARVGDNVTLTCTGGTLVRMASVGTVTHSS